MEQIPSNPSALRAKSSRKLSRTFLSRLIVIISIGQILSIGWSLYENKKVQEQDIRDKLSLCGKQLGAVAVVSRDSFDFTYLGQLIDELVKDEDILRITYIDKGLPVIDRKLGKKPDKFFTLDIPVMVGATNTGKIVFEYTNERVEKNLVKLAVMTISLQGTILVCLSFFVYFFFNRDIGSKVTAINYQMNQAINGDLSSRNSVITDDEFGSISNGLNLLIDWLATTIGKFEAISGNVAEATDHLNKTFKEVINGVNRQQLSTDNALISVQNSIDSLQQVIEFTDDLKELSSESTLSLHEILTASRGVVFKMERLSKYVNSSYETVLVISNSSKDVSAVAGSATNSMEYADQAVSSINHSVSRIGSIVKETTELSVKTNSIIAERGIISVRDAIESMQRIDHLVASLSTTISSLGARSKDIAKVLDVIKEVTEQTKLLSLNAQILSGQAGEYGRPFAVVAAEMKTLSDKTATSTKEIETIISAIQNEIRTAVASANATSDMVTEGKTVAARANDALQNIQEASHRSTEMVKTIEEVAVEQNEDLVKIVHAFDEIRNLIQEVNRATSEEDKSMSDLLEGFRITRDAMEVTRLASEEQARSIQLISENISLANDKTMVIADASKQQHVVSDEMVKAMKRVIQIGAETVTGVRDVSHRIVTIGREADALHREIKAFKIEEQTPS